MESFTFILNTSLSPMTKKNLTLEPLFLSYRGWKKVWSEILRTSTVKAQDIKSKILVAYPLVIEKSGRANF